MVLNANTELRMNPLERYTKKLLSFVKIILII